VAALRAGKGAERVRALGTAALPAVMELVLDGRGEAQREASRVASDLTGIEGRLSTDAEENEAILERWGEWWYQHRRDFARFSGWERAHGRITETQFGKWLGRVITLRFGHSIRDGRPVGEKLGEALPITLLLSLLSMALAYLIAVPLGIHAAVRQGSLGERITTVVLFVLYSLPSFWVAMVLILLFGGVGLLDWFPIHGLASEGLEEATGWTWLGDRAHHLVLPIACLTYGSLAVISRYQRTAMLEVIRQDYIRTARAKGLGERAVIFRHALRNSLLPVITLMGLQFPYLISGSVIIERIFNIPGMGMMTFDAFLNRDYPVIIAVAVLSAVLTLAGLILSDLAYALVDPRIQLEERS
jgi:peptide/nickel transport system permease protein